MGLGGTRYTDARAASTATLDLYVQTLRYLASDGGNSILDTTSYPELLTRSKAADKIQGSDEEKAAAEDAFKRISLAHALLSDPAQRRLHDAGAQGPSGARRAQPAYAG